MVPREPHHPLRWQFVRGYTQTGKLALESRDSFESLTESMNDARQHGYGDG